jgi:hypothetical protein
MLEKPSLLSGKRLVCCLKIISHLCVYTENMEKIIGCAPEYPGTFVDSFSLIVHHLGIYTILTLLYPNNRIFLDREQMESFNRFIINTLLPMSSYPETQAKGVLSMLTYFMFCTFFSQLELFRNIVESEPSIQKRLLDWKGIFARQCVIILANIAKKDDEEEIKEQNNTNDNV